MHASTVPARTSALPVLPALCALACLAGCLSGGNDPGNGSATGRSWILRDGRGEPVAGATVKAIPVDYVPKGSLLKAADTLSVATARTDGDGRYTFDSLAAGEYNILGERDGEVSYLDSVSMGGDREGIPADTLRAPGSVRARIAIEPNHDPRNAFVQVLGTHHFASVDSAGWFTLKGLADGEYSLRIVNLAAGYPPAFLSVTARSGEDDTLAAPIPLVFTGIPVVRRLEARYDAVREVARLSWSPVDYRSFRAYAVFRSLKGDNPGFGQLVGLAEDTAFTDSLASQFRFDPRPKDFEYRVRVINRSDTTGPSYASAAIKAAPTQSVAFTYTLLAPGLTGAQGDTARLAVGWSSPVREADSLEWSWEDGRTFRHVRLTGKSGTDTAVVVLPSRTGPISIHVRLRDREGDFWKRTFTGMVDDGSPVADAGRDTTVTVRDTVRLRGRGTDNGRIVAWEWDIGNTGAFVRVADGDTAVPAAAAVGHQFHVLRVTDDRDNRSVDTVRVTVRDDKPIVTLAWDPVRVDQGGGYRLAGKATDLGRIAKYEWDLGTGVFTQGNGPDTVFPRGTPSGVRQVRLRVIDDDGNSGESGIEVTVSAWDYLSDLPAKIRNANIRMATVGGKLFLLAEFDPATSYLNAFYSFDPATGVWAQLAPRPRAVWYQALAASSGKVLSFGGGLSSPSATRREVWEYEPRLDEWVRLSDMPQGECYDCVAATLDDTVYVLGSNLSKNLAFAPATGAWKDAGPGLYTSSNRLPTAMGGTLYMASLHNYTEFLAWRPGMTYWEDLPHQPSRGSELALVGAGGKVFLLGGGIGSKQVHRYDPSAKSWKALAPMIWSIRNNPAVESGGVVYAIGDGKIQQYDPASEP